MLIPQGLAFAQIVRVPPVAGLWSGIAAMIGYALFGPSRQLMVGPEAGTAMMVAAVLTSAGIEPPEQRLGGAALLAIMVGVVLVVAGAFRLGAIADFLSRPILVGYINGIAAVLIVSQLPGVLGIRGTAGRFHPAGPGNRLAGRTHAQPDPLAVGLRAGVPRRRSPSRPRPSRRRRGRDRRDHSVRVCFDFESRGIQVLGPIEQGLPSFGLPELPAGSVLDLVPGALSIALLIYASSALTSRIFADKHRYEFRANAELFGIAAANFATGLVHGVPAAGSDARTVINDAAGSRTQAAGLIAAAVVAATIFLLGSGHGPAAERACSARW